MKRKQSKKNNKKVLKIVAVLATIAILCVIGFGIFKLTNNSDGKISRIKIISSSWSGWSENYKPEEKESYCEIALHEKCVVAIGHFSNTKGDEWDEEEFSFEITEINEDSVTIHTFQVFSDSEKGIDLSSKKQDFVIKADKPLELTTPTMDAGDIYTLSLVD